MSDDGVMVYGDGGYGMRIDNGLPDNHLGFVDSHMAASKERVEHARLYWPEIDASDLEAIGTTG